MGLKSALVVLPAVVLCAQMFAQTPAPRVSGEVTAVDSSTGKLTVKVDKGGSRTVEVSGKARVVRVPPGEKDPHKFVPIAVGDIGTGDRVLAVGPLAADGSTISAARVYVLSKGDVARQQEEEREAWQQRGVSGTLVNLDPSSKEITISARTHEGLKPLLVEVSAKTIYRRYAPDSVRSVDAKASSWDELKLGDEVHILGEKSADGSHLQAEQIYSGAFETIAATVVSVDAASNSIHVAQIPGKHPVTIRTTSETLLRRLPQEMAAALAQRMHGARAGKENAPASHEASAGSLPGGARRNLDLRQLLERMPPITLADLKPGDAVIVSSSKGMDPAKITAIRVVAGVEPFLAAAPRGNSGQLNLGEWSMEMSADPGE